LGGTDQLFNLLVGRDLMGKLGLAPQIVMTLPLLEGLDGVEKMSKSLGNYIAVEDPAEDMFGKLMSISDALMWKYWTLLTDRTPAEVEALERQVAAGERHPMEAKFSLARTVTEDFHGAAGAAAAEARFRRVHQQRELPAEVGEVVLAAAARPLALARVLVLAALAESNSAARRLLQQGGVRLEGEVVRDPQASVDAAPGSEHLLQVGKRRFARVVFRTPQ
jgi:tyrosyl-tRNA synthetase